MRGGKEGTVNALTAIGTPMETVNSPPAPAVETAETDMRSKTLLPLDGSLSSM